MVKVGQKYTNKVYKDDLIYTIVNVFDYRGKGYAVCETGGDFYTYTTGHLENWAELVKEEPKVGEVWIGKNTQTHRVVENVFTALNGTKMVVYRSGDLGGFDVSPVNNFVNLGEKHEPH